MKKIALTLLLILSVSLFTVATERLETSVAGFFPLQNSGRLVYNFNPGWRFFRGDVQNAEKTDFDDSAWEVVSTPHSVELMPAEASGGRNYQGIAWYRKKFVVPAEAKGKDLTIHFEAVMGQQTVYVNGQKVLEHLGGYLPFTINLSDLNVQAGDNCVIAVMADNSNDKTYPPGKPQYTLDFAYHGGIYRDVWLIAKSKVAISDAVDENKVAGGGLFVHYDNISEKSADVFVNTDVKNRQSGKETVVVETSILSEDGKVVKKTSTKLTINGGTSKTAVQSFKIPQPNLWEPDRPYLYRIVSQIKKGNQTIDGGITKAGIRKAEFRGKDGFWLNGKPFGQLVGTNRHQDFAYVGNAVPNSQQWRDVKRLREAGCRIIRVAHYPMDPSFMDACDELGMFIIVATPGWQYWNKDPKFAELVHENTRQIIRRDRNHPSVLMWEPILNETRYPKEFAMEALKITRDEFPYPGRPVAAADVQSEGVNENYDMVYGWPGDDAKGVSEKNIFTREFGENVDDWYAHNNNNRASRSWGERPLSVQALSLAKSYDEMYHTSGGFIGGAQWHSFDHQRGYHPDPYWGGLMDAFRQPKYAYYMFRSQVEPNLNRPQMENGPTIFVAHELSQFSDKDIVVFSNCDSVRLTAYDGEFTITKPVLHQKGHMPNLPVVFENVWDFWKARSYSYTERNWQKVNFVFEGIIGGKVVCSEKKMPSRRSTKLRLYIDDLGKKLTADGSDFVVVVAEVTDDNGNVRRLAKDNIVFTVEGEGRIIGDATIGANPRAVEFGSAPILVQSTRKAGKIKVKAHVQFEGTLAPTATEIEFGSVPSDLPFCFVEQAKTSTTSTNADGRKNAKGTELTEEEKAKLLKEVDQQQMDFGVQPK